ncbi:MAG: DegT/DnrJ/EryC1/StrS aminotransferase family protein [Bryobacteraceae bacterium]
MNEGFIEFARPDYGDAEIAAVAAALASGWTTTGPRTAAFEKAFCEYTGAPFALGVNSGSAALHLALAALGIAPGDEVITTPLTFCATVNAILLAGATPILADIGDDLNISPDAIRRAITPRTRAILPVHLAGLPCDMEAIGRLADEHGFFVVEDAAHAAGASRGSSPNWTRVGAGASDAVAFSFYATKNLSTGEGGMVTCRDARLRERMRILSLHGISHDAWERQGTKDNWAYDVVECGFKYNMSDLMAAIGLVQLARLDEMNQRRAEIARAYNAAFAEMPELELPPESAVSTHAWQLYILRLNLRRLCVDRSQFIARMRRRGVGCSVHFKPIPMHPYYRAKIELRDPCQRAMDEYPRLVSLPLSSRLDDAEVARVIAAVKDTCC